MNIEIIISTINNDTKVVNSNLMNSNNITIINQKPDRLNDEKKITTEKGVRWVDYDQKGLSKSRNLGITMSSADYIYLTDDDVTITDNFNQTIKEAINQHPEVDIFVFKVSGINKEFKKYASYPKDIGFLESLKISSVQLVMKRKFIKDNDLIYDELFGAGAKYGMGEENIFIFDALKKGAKIRYIPEEIAQVYIGESSWFTGFNQKYFFDRGATFYRMFGPFSFLYSVIFCIRKKKLYKANFGLLSAVKYSYQGIRDYKKNKV